MTAQHSSKELVRSPVVSLDQFAGKWIAWDRERQRIIASARTLAEVAKMVATAGETEPVFEKVPKANRFSGAAR